MGEKDDPPVPGAAATEPTGLTREQRSAMPPFATVRAFEAIGTTGGIRRAALALSVDHAAVRPPPARAGTLDGHGAGGPIAGIGRAAHAAGARSIIAGSPPRSRSWRMRRRDLRYRSDDTRLRLWCMPGLASECSPGGSAASRRRTARSRSSSSRATYPPNFDRHQADGYLHYVIDHGDAPADPKLRAGRIARPAVLAVASPDFVARLGRFPRSGRPAGQHAAPRDQPRSMAALVRAARRRCRAGHQGPPASGRAISRWPPPRRGQGVALANALLVHDDLREGRPGRAGATGRGLSRHLYVHHARRRMAQPDGRQLPAMAREVGRRIAGRCRIGNQWRAENHLPPAPFARDEPLSREVRHGIAPNARG
ncbi:MAG: hypothetical protein WDN24_11985 [Sphingomonas sp.]